ncbi:MULTISPECIES: hypothetical protein [Novosphingobium]|uniref:hypothetical protein n=1 Tax=Novosphingobium TaxID=165696 RepID=UPI000D30D5CC|nr:MULTISPECIES: hypothetical protein [Novosphingobium]PTR07852.1 hypothetical protein C8K11_11363 [Novosphingobium sp. GV055]PUB00665.1 hypothetical protein C8K12_11363 [Novosphingobium sp. GV061]PUB16074.1 hypothetical protein C8K14_11363 [Novosphingobium sp. GV079]PUB39539.1 hypothetical protein C8K10_11363 [Novosphingobium sp. GV027]WQD93792.1 hypothetical protein U0041_04115 [Novosphingobium capsulatum]
MSDQTEDAAIGPALAVLTNHDEAAQAEAAELGFAPPPVEYDPPVPELPANGPSSDAPPASGAGEGEGASGADSGAQGDSEPPAGTEGGQVPSEAGGSGSADGESPPSP